MQDREEGEGERHWWVMAAMVSPARSGGGPAAPRARRGVGGAGDAGPDTHTRRQSGFYGLSAANLDKKAVSFDRFKGKVVLVTNVASR